MKHLIIDNEKRILAVSDNYSTQEDDLDKGRMVHVIDGQRFDQYFTHVTVSSLPENFDAKVYKYVDGDLVLSSDLSTKVEQEGYDKAVYDIYFGGNN